MAPVQQTAQQDIIAKKLFKFVSGVLNGAFSEDTLPSIDAEVRSMLGSATPTDLHFAHACEALAQSIKDGHVPKQGQDVLRKLLCDQHMVAPSASLYPALDVPRPPPSDRSAQQLFQLVSSVMNSVKTQGEAESYSESVRDWLPCSGRCSFRQACDALALAIKAGAVPERSVEMLKVLHVGNAVDVGDSLGCVLQTSSMVEADAETASDAASVLESHVNSGDDSSTDQQIDRPESANRLFKTVCGMLNDDRTPPTVCSEHSNDVKVWIGVAEASFSNLCDSLAVAIEQQFVPQKGCDVLCKLAERMRLHGLTFESRLVLALKLDFDKVDKLQAAKRIFAYVKNVLQGNGAEKECSSTDIALWWGGTQRMHLQSACAALAAVINAGEIPEKPLDELCEFVVNFPEHDLDSSPLELALQARLCPKCGVNPCRPSNVFARGRDTNNATLAEDLESTPSRAVSVAALGEALGGRNIVEIARGVDNTPWVIADLVKEQEKSPVCFVIRRHNLVIPGLFASTAPARLRML